jgi:hypothetical protein
MAGLYRAGTAWPKDGNPYAATHGYSCHLVDGNPGPAWSAYFDCRWYYRNLVAGVRTWQARRRVTETRKAWIKGHYEKRAGTVGKWVSFDPDRLTR